MKILNQVCFNGVGVLLISVAFIWPVWSAPTNLKPFSATKAACRNWRSFAIEQRNSENGLKTDQIVVTRADGEILFHWEDAPYSFKTRHQMWSVSKTLTSMIAATAIAEGRLKVTDRLSQFIPESLRRTKRGRSDYSSVKVDDLIMMTSGFKWSEHNNDDVKEASDMALMYSDGYRNFTRYLIDLDFEARPGRIWNYSSVNADLLMAVLKKVYRDRYDDLPWTNLFNPLGISTAAFEQDGAGVYLGASYVFLSAGDLAKIGKLLLSDGMVGERRILPEGWVDRIKEPLPSSYRMIHSRRDFDVYGVFSKGGWWLNRKVPGVGRQFLNAPESLIFASGFMGQWLLVLPDQGMIIARTGHDQNPDAKIDGLVAGAIACFAK